MSSSALRFAFYGHHKCASTWIHSVLEQVVADTGHRICYLYDERQFDRDLPRWVEKEGIEFLSYVNADHAHTKDLPAHRGFHIVRDPRDLLVSAYFSHKNSHPTHAWPELIPYREKLEGLSKEEGLLAELDFSATWFDHMARWDYDQDHILEIQQETFTPDPYRGFLEVFRHLGFVGEEHYNKSRWPGYLARSAMNILNRKKLFPLRSPMDTIPGERLLGIVYDNRFEKYTGGRKSGKEDSKSHYRKGVGGDWVNHFFPELEAGFKERYGDLVLKLGYADSPDWSAEAEREKSQAGG